MKTVIICSGSICDYPTAMNIVIEAGYVICADGGTRHAYHMGVVPDLIIGDMDSSASEYIDYYMEKGVKLNTYPSNKDKTDAQLCLEYALTLSGDIVMLGATGSRFDHSLANASLLRLGVDCGANVRIVDSNNEIYMTKDRLSLTGKKGDYVSLIPMSGRAEGICITGVRYPLEDAVMELGQSYGISNCFEAEEIEIRVGRGYLLVIKAKD